MYNESKLFTMARDSSQLLTVRVYDSDMFSNDFLGEAKIDLASVSGPELNFQTIKGGKPSGTVALKIERIEERKEEVSVQSRSLDVINGPFTYVEDKDAWGACEV